MKINLWIFFGLYLLLLVTLTLFDSIWGRNGINLVNANINYKQYFENTVNLVPFKTIMLYINILLNETYDDLRIYVLKNGSITYGLTNELIAFFVLELFKQKSKNESC